jgi:non-specific serine/threonine protein kinase/serine/threonine-protein kinase
MRVTPVNDPTPDIEEIGPYRIVRCLGEGGKGRVYEAEQTVPVKRTVALKVLRSSSTDPSDALRFSAEQQALALMDHPGIAKVFDAGTEADGRQWFTMELVDGLPMNEFADEYQLDNDARIELFVRVCRAVQHAHQKGIIHRDLKPSNVLVTMEDGIAAPKVIDFGVAKAVGLRLTEETLLTQFGAIIGTPAYMSPEQAEGTVFEIDTRADIYSLGVMLYELLVGCLPVDPRITGYPGFIAFLKQPDHEAPTPATRYRQLPGDQQADLASARRLSSAQLRTALSGDLRWIVMSALEKDSARRYQSAAALGDDLERFVRGDAISVRPPSVGYQLRKLIARNRVVVVAASVVIVALAGGTIAATIGMVRAEREATVANTVSDFLEQVFAEASPFSRTGEEVTARQLLETAAANIETELAGNPAVQGRLMLRIGAAYRGMGMFDEATPLLERALDLLREGDAPALQIADAEYELGYHLIFMSQFDRSRTLLENAIDYYRDALGHSDSRLAVAISDLVFNALRSSRDVPAAYELLQREIPPATEILGPESQPVAQLHYMRCWTLRDMARTRDALDACQDSLALVKRAFEGVRPIWGHNTLAVGHTHRALGQDEAAIERYLEVLEINRGLYGADHAEIAYALAAMSHSHLRLGNRDAALRHAEEAVAMIERVHGTESTEYALVLGSLARILADYGRFDEADAAHTRIIAIDSASLGADSRRVAHRKAAYAAMLLRQGRIDEAGAMVSDALRVLRPASGSGGIEITGALLTAGEVAHRLGQLDVAERHLREAHAIASVSPDDNPVQLAEANSRLARLLPDSGE